MNTAVSEKPLRIKASVRKDAMLSVVSLLLLVVLLFPLYWIVATSLKTEQEIFRVPTTLWPEVINTASYAAQLEMGDFNMFRSFGNSLTVSLAAMAISVLLAVPGSYGIAQMLPVSVLLTPMFIMFRDFKLLNTQFAPILADATIGIPFSILILKNYFGSIPGELENAAAIDGCNRFTSFLLIFLPIALPGVVVCAIFSFLYAWGDLAYGMTFITDQTMRPITAGIFNFLGQYGTKWSYLTAFAVVTIIPVALIFLFMQKYIISGLTSGAVKG